MTATLFPAVPPTKEEISKTAGLLRKARPAFGPLIDFYEAVFTAQEACRGRVNDDPIRIEAELLNLKLENEMPLVDPSQFVIHPDAATELTKTLCSLAQTHAPQLAPAARSLETALADGRLDLKGLFRALLDDRQPELETRASELDIPAGQLVFFVQSAMEPFLRTQAEQLAAYLDGAAPMKKGYCPICGSQPDVAFLDQEGKKYLVCSLCAHQWQTKRMGCSSCGSTDLLLQHYFFHDEEKEYRVYLCDSCHKYLKVVDLRKLDRIFIPRLEQVASLHLDMKAQEKGYTHAVRGKEI